MRYEFYSDRAVFMVENPKSEHPSKHLVSFAGISMDKVQIARLLDSLCRQVLGKSPVTQQRIVHVMLKPFVAFLRGEGLTYPVSSVDWQIFLIKFLHFFMIDRTYSQQSVQTRAKVWTTTIYTVFTLWIEEEIIPYDVEVPRIDLKSEVSPLSSAQLLGHRRRRKRRDDAPIQKLVVDVSFSRNDADYLTHLEQDCRAKIQAIRAACVTHWRAMRANHKTGKALAAKLTSAEVDTYFERRRYYKYSGNDARALTSPTLPDGHFWALAMTQRLLACGKDLKCISQPILRNSPHFRTPKFSPSKTRSLSYPALSALNKLPVAIMREGAAEFYSFLGMLSTLDVAAACSLLIIEHPQFTPRSLTNAQLLNVRGKLYIEATGTDGKFRFAVDKPRARKRKDAVLSSLALEIVSDVIDSTAPIRALMRRTGHKAWRYLFLGSFRGGVLGPFPTDPGRHLTRNPVSLISVYPELKEQGLTRGSFDFRRLRNTMGVLRWFESGSIVEMSRCLGNTEQVALEHYLPLALLNAWNVRIIRRFQNTLIMLAAHEEEYLLEVTDFSNFADLLHFMAQLIGDHRKGSSPIANEIHSRFGAHASRVQASGPIRDDSRDRLLSIRCSARSLAYLYAFDDYVTHLRKSEREYVDPMTGLSTQAFIDLSRMIRHACETRQVSEALHEQLDVAALGRMHQNALCQQDALRAQFARFSLRKEWEC